MKKYLLITLMLVCAFTYANAQKQADIKFDKTTMDLGKFPESNPVQKCTFTFTNTGNAPLIINQAIASCGCTVPEYTKEPVAPGKTGTTTVRASSPAISRKPSPFVRTARQR